MAMETVAVRLPTPAVNIVKRILQGHQERDLPGGAEKTLTLSHVNRSIWLLGLEQYRIRNAIRWVTERPPRYTLEEAAELTGMKVGHLARELHMRGIQPPGGMPARPWPSFEVEVPVPAEPELPPEPTEADLEAIRESLV